MAFFIAQLTRTSKALSLWPTRALASLDLLVRGVMKNAFLPPFSQGGWVSKRFSSPG